MEYMAIVIGIVCIPLFLISGGLIPRRSAAVKKGIER
jgi:hypothetical protein